MTTVPTRTASAVEQSKLTAEQLNEEMWPTPDKLRSGNVKAVLVGFLLPVFLWVYYVAAFVALFGFSRWMRHANRAATFGNDGIPLGDVVAVIAVPAAALVATLGTSLGFYIQATMDAAHGRHQFQFNPLEPGWMVIEIAVPIALVLVGAALNALSGHRSGRRIYPFQRDVDREKAIEELVKVRTRPGPGFAPWHYIGAAEWADEAPSLNTNDDVSVTMWEAWKRGLWRKPYDNRQMVIVGAFGVLYGVGGFIAATWAGGGKSWHPIVIPLYVAAVYVSFYGARAGFVVSTYYWQLRCRRRVEHLYDQAARAAAATTELADDFVAQVRQLRSTVPVRESPEREIRLLGWVVVIRRPAKPI